jgi:hypothetical protein
MMKVRMRSDVRGVFHGQRVDGFYGIRKGDLVDLEDRDVLRYLKIGLVELKLDGEFGRGEYPNAADIAKFEKQLRSEEAKRPKQAEKTTSVTYDGATYIYPTD